MNYIPGGLGVYHCYDDGRLEQVFLNDGYYDLMNVSREDRDIYQGFSVLDAVFPQDREMIQKTLRTLDDTNRLCAVDIRVMGKKNRYKWVNVKAKLAGREDDRCVLYVFYSDIDQLKRVQLQLRTRQEALAMFVATGRVLFWTYDIDTKQVKQVVGENPPAEYQRNIKNVTQILVDQKCIHKDDIKAFENMYRELEQDAESCECTVRVMNYSTKRFEWRNIIYTRLQDDMYDGRTAIGFSVNADVEQENRLHYEREIQLRKEMMKDAISYYQINITKGVFEEYHSIYQDWQHIKPGDQINEAIRQHILEGVFEEDREKVRSTIFSSALIKRYQQGESSVSLVFRSVLPGVGVRWTRATATIIEHYHSGDIIAMIFNQDIDVQRKDQLAINAIMDEELESVTVLNTETGIAHFAQINVEHSNVSVDEDFVYSERYKKLIEREVLESDQKACEEFFGLSSLIESLEHEDVIKHIYRIKDTKGKVLRKKIRAFYLDETHREIIMIRRDITDLYEEEQRQKHVLQDAVDDANRANQAKSEFLSRMSHDMRTPLNAILSFSGQEIMAKATKEQQRAYLEKIHFSGEYLLGIINDVLDMSKIEQNKMVLNEAPYSSKEFLELVNDVISEECKRKNIDFIVRFQTSDVKWIMTDKVRFNQIFMNLLSNAVKFTEPGGQIEFLTESVAVLEDHVEQRRFIVRDNGIGMSKEFIPHAFDSFVQENNEHVRENNQGTGLGLSIVKKIVELMNGSITLESEQGRGTTFTIELPITICTEAVKQEEARHIQADLKGLHVLLCEDNPLNAEIVAMLLDHKECIVEEAENGEVGLEKFEQSEPGYYQVILMDIRMPVMDGYTATKAIRKLDRPDAQTVPIIALTADVFTEDERISEKAGMNAHLSKPIEANVLYETISRLINL